MSHWNLREVFWTTAAGLGAAGLSTLMVLAPLVSPRHLFLYHLEGDAGPFLTTAAILVILAWLIAVAYLLMADACAALARRWLLVVFYLAVARLFLQSVAVVADIPMTKWQKIVIFAVVAVVVTTFAWVRPLAFERRSDDLRHVLAFCGAFCAISLLQLGWIGWQARNLNPPWKPVQRQVGQPAMTRHGKIVWILFDELSYQQLYGRRAAGLELPEFDRLARQSVVFTQVKPAGYYTERVVPSLMAGRRFVDLQATTLGWPLVRPEGGTHWERFEPSQTVLADAESMGLKVDIAGWYNPYCRIFRGVVDRCRWVDPENQICGIVSQMPVKTDLRLVLAWIKNKALGRPDLDLARDIGAHRVASDTLRKWSLQEVSDPTSDFLFLHLPIPHPLGITRRDGRAGPANYLDNLVLADNTLAQIRQKMGSNWDDATVVVMGDHAWRVDFWQRSPGWTQEEQRVSGGVFDDRPGYIVKMPGQQVAMRMDGGFDALRTREMFQKVLQGQLNSAPELLHWATTQPAAR